MKTNHEPQPYGQTHIQHMTRLAVATLTVAILFGLMAGCDATDPVASRVIVEPPPPVDDGGDDGGRDDGGRDDNAPACPSPSASLVGTWDLIGYSKNGTESEVSGTWLFGANGTLTIQATIGGRDSSGEFRYNQTGLSAMIANAPYSLSFCGNEATLTSAPFIYTLRSIH